LPSPGYQEGTKGYRQNGQRQQGASEIAAATQPLAGGLRLAATRFVVTPADLTIIAKTLARSNDTVS
jgi:hypothetical protein